MVEVGEPYESSYLYRIGRYRLVLNGLDLGWFHPNLSWRDFVAKEDCFRNVELALVLIN